MSQNPNEQVYFTHLLNPNKKLAQTRLHHHHNTHNLHRHSNNIPVLVCNMVRLYRHRNKFSVNNNKRFLTTNSTTNSKISNNKKNTPFQNLQKQPEAFQQSQPQPRFKEPQPQPPKDNCRGKRVAKRATVDLVDEDEEEEEHIRQCARWTRDEEILLTGCWIETSENGQIRADRTEDSFWGQIMDDFDSATTKGYRTKHMLTSKWTRINGDCQKLNAIYKHIERKSGENEAGHIEAAKITFAAQQPNGRKFQLEHAWRILKGTAAYEAKKQKEMAMMEFKEMEFLTIDAD
ncbi:hypothetical protein Tco_1039917 [Tanacetum coccineum]